MCVCVYTHIYIRADTHASLPLPLLPHSRFRALENIDASNIYGGFTRGLAAGFFGYGAHTSALTFLLWVCTRMHANVTVYSGSG